MKKLLSITTILCALSIPVLASAHSDEPTSYLEQAILKLPSDKAEDFRDTMQQAHEDNKDLYDQAHQLREDMHDILTADTFDKDAFLAKSAELRQIHDKINENLDEAFAEGNSELSVKERQKLAMCMEKKHEMHKAAEKAAQ